jgi:hypothetical protein
VNRTSRPVRRTPASASHADRRQVAYRCQVGTNSDICAGDPVVLDAYVEIVAAGIDVQLSALGAPACPAVTATGDWQITNRRTGQKLEGPDLIVHLIGAHNFFEGHGTSYRVDPRELAALLELGTFARRPT